MDEPIIVDLVIARRVDFRVFRGDSRPTPLILTRLDTGAPFNLTGIGVDMHVRRKPDDEDTIAEFSIGNGLTVSGPDMNIITILSMKDVPAKRSAYDLQLTFPDGQVVTYFYGFIGGIADSTRI